MFEKYTQGDALFSAMDKAVGTRFFPAIDDRAAWAAVDAFWKRSALDMADGYEREGYPVILASQYLEFHRGGNRRVQMQCGRVGYDHAVRTVCEGGFDRRFDRDVPDLFFGKRAFVRTKEYDVVLSECDQVAQMPPPDRSVTGYQKFHKKISLSVYYLELYR